MDVKGTAVATLPLFIKHKFSDNGFNQWLNALSPEAKEVFSHQVMATSWFPLKSILVEPTQKMCTLFYNGNARGAWENGRFSADHALKGVYKIFIKLGSPEFLIKKASTILPTYYRPCTMELVSNQSQSAQVRITEFKEIDPTIEARIGGWIERALEISGCKDVKVSISQSLTTGKDYSEFCITWK